MIRRSCLQSLDWLFDRLTPVYAALEDAVPASSKSRRAACRMLHGIIHWAHEGMERLAPETEASR